jgi:hypothetical protein
VPWQIAVGSDLQNSKVESKRTIQVRFVNWYIAKFFRAAQYDGVLATKFLEVANLMEQPAALMSPGYRAVSIVKRERGVSLQLPAVVRPMQERLPLPSATRQITRLARKLELSDVTADCFPAFDLPNVLVGHSSSHIVAAVPLEPAAWIVRMYPSFPAPFRERLTGFNTEVVEGVVARSPCQPGMLEPACRKLIAAIGNVLTTEHAEAKHFAGRQIGFELWIEVATNRLDEFVPVTPLHPIIDCDRPSHIAAAQFTADLGARHAACRCVKRQNCAGDHIRLLEDRAVCH